MVFGIYDTISKRGIEDAIRSEMVGEMENGMLAIVKCAKDKIGYFADCLYESMKVNYITGIIIRNNFSYFFKFGRIWVNLLILPETSEIFSCPKIWFWQSLLPGTGLQF